MDSSDEDTSHAMRIDRSLDLKKFKDECSLEFSLMSMEGEESYPREKHLFQDPELYFKHDDLMKYVDLAVIDSGCELSPFEKMKQKMTDISDGEGKLFKEIKKAGVGEICPPNAVVKFHYLAFRENEEVPYDISRLRRRFPECKQLGTEQLLPGLELAIRSMRLSENSNFLIHHDLAYGELGCGERIPPESTLLFKVELLEIESMKLPEDEDLEVPDEGKFDFERLYKKAEAHLKRGTQLKRDAKNNFGAIKEYRKATGILSRVSLSNDEEEKKKKHLITKAYINLMICFNDEKIHTKACCAFRDALYEGVEEAQRNPRLFFNFAKAQAGLQDFKRARELFKKVKTLDPRPEQNKRIDEELKDLALKEEKFKADEKFIYGRMFSSLQ